MQMENIFIQLWRNARLFDDATEGGMLPVGAATNGASLAATSSKYGICLTLAPGNRIASAISMLLINGQNVPNENLRLVDYPDGECEIVNLAVSHDGEIFAVAVNRPGVGAFVELFDVRAFDPKEHRQVFPLASVRVSADAAARIIAFSWNPCQNSFAVSTSDGTLATIQYELTNGTSFTIIGSQPMKSPVSCISWSPKGKQLTVGDVVGRLHQLKPELAAIRVIEALNGSTTKRCVNVCWLGTTEWLVAYADSSSGDDTPVVALLTVKKQQPPSWAFIDGAIERNMNTDKPTTLRFCPLLDWQLILICSSISITGTVIAFTGGEWRRLNVPIVWPKENENTHIYPIGCTFDLSNILPVVIAGQQIPAQPVFHIFTATGWLISYNIVSLIERPVIVKMPEVFDTSRAKFGNPPANFTPRKSLASSSTATTPLQNVYQSQSSLVNSQSTLLEQSPDMVAIRGAKKSTSMTKATNAAETSSLSTHSAATSDANVQQLQTQAPAQMPVHQTPAAESAIDPLVEQYVRSLDSYCKLRNAWTRDIDLVRELRGAIGDLVPDVESSLDSLTKMGDCARDLFNLIHESRRQLHEYELRVDESEELAEKMKVIRDFVSRDHAQIESELDDRLVEFGKRTGDIDVKLSKLRIDIRRAQDAQQNDKPVSPMDVKESKECTLNTRRVGTWVSRSYAELQQTIRMVTELRGHVMLAQRAGKLPTAEAIDGDKNNQEYVKLAGTPGRLPADRSTFSSRANVGGISTPRNRRQLLNGTTTTDGGGSGDKYIDGLQTEVMRCLQLGDRLEVHARRTVALEKTAAEKTTDQLVDVQGRLNQVVGTPNRLAYVSVGTQSPKVVVRPKPTPKIPVDQPPAGGTSSSKLTIGGGTTSTNMSEGAAPTLLTPSTSANIDEKVDEMHARRTAASEEVTVEKTIAQPAGVKGSLNQIVETPNEIDVVSGVTQSPNFVTRPKPTPKIASDQPPSGGTSFSSSKLTTSSNTTSLPLPSTPVSSKIVFSPTATTLPMTAPTNTSSSFVAFSFKLPSTVTSGDRSPAQQQTPTVPVSVGAASAVPVAGGAVPALPTSSTSANVVVDEGMDEDSATTATSNAAAPSSGITFSFNSMGLGVQKPVESSLAPKNVFNMFSGNKPQGSSLFGGGGGTASGSFFSAAPAANAPAFSGPLFGGSASTGAAASTPSTGGQGSSLFGGGATFGSASPFNVAGAQASSPVSTTSPFSGKSFGTAAAGQQKTFGMLAGTPTTNPTSCLFGGGGSASTPNVSPFDGGANTASASPFANARKSPFDGGPAAGSASPFANAGKSAFGGGGGAVNSSFGGGGSSGQTG